MENDGPNIDISSMSDADRLEVQSFIENSNQQMSLNKLVSSLTKTCWEKCIVQPVSQGSLSSTEEACASNCVSRWLESQNTVIKALSESQGQRGR